MARKEMFSKEEILNKSVLFIKEFGIEKLTVRDLSKFIGCSTQPIFKNYKNMDDFKVDLKSYLHKDYELFIKDYVDESNYLFTISYAYSLYAIKEPKVFSALFLTDLAGSRTIEEVLNTERNIPTIIAMRMQYNLSREKAERIYRDIRFYTHGIASQLCNGSIKLMEEDVFNLISNMINVCLKD